MSGAASTGLVNRAVLVAQLAVQADEAGSDTLRPLAIARYRRSVTLITAQLVRESDAARRDSLLRFAQLYQQRARALTSSHGLTASPLDAIDLAARPVALPVEPRAAYSDEYLLRAALAESAPGPLGHSSSSSSLSASCSFSLLRVPSCSADLSSAGAPSEGWQRTYRLCDNLRRSMEHGAALTSDGSVFVPSAVWHQRGARFTNLGAKSAAFDELSSQTAPFASLDFSDGELLLRELGVYCEALDAIQLALSRALPASCGIASAPYAGAVQQQAEPDAASRLMRSLGNAFAKTLVSGGAERNFANSSAYTAQLRAMLLSLAGLQRLHERCAAADAPPTLARALHLLERAHRFVRDVVLVLVSSDVALLLARYLRKAEESFVLDDVG